MRKNSPSEERAALADEARSKQDDANEAAAEIPAVPTALAIPKMDKSIIASARAALSEAKLIAVETPKQSQAAQLLRAQLQTSIKSLIETRLTATRPLDAVKAIIMSWFAGPIRDREEARDHLDVQILAFDKKSEEEAAAAQAILDAAAEKERARLEGLATKATARGDTAKANQFLDRADVVVAPMARSVAVRSTGSSIVKRWTFEVTDASKVNALFLTPDLVKIGKQVVALGKDAQSVVGEGVRIFQTSGVASRSTAAPKKGW